MGSILLSIGLAAGLIYFTRPGSYIDRKWIKP